MHNYAQVTANFDETLKLIFFEAKEKQSQSNREFILPIDENSTHFSIDLVQKAIDKINESLNVESKIKK